MTDHATQVKLIGSVTSTFRQKYCAVGASEVCENPKLLACAYKDYLRKNYYYYEKFFEKTNRWEDQLVYLLKEIHTYKFIFEDKKHNVYSHTPSDSDMQFSKTYSDALVGVIGIKLLNYPISY